MSKSYTPPPTIQAEKRVEGDATVRRHPAFGSISFATTHGNRADSLFGVDIDVRSTIRMRLSLAHEVERHSRHHVNDRCVVEIEMSEAQFAQAISGMNHSEGVPVTIRAAPEFGPVVQYPRIARENVEERLKERLREEVADEIAKITECFSRVSELANGVGAVPKRELQEAVRSLQASLGNLPANMAFFGEMLEAKVDKLLSDAKIELHATAVRYGGAAQHALLDGKTVDNGD